jgi:hypothetical protein
MKWIGVVATVALVISCFYPWVFIESKNIIVSGIKSDGTNFAKPGYFHFVMAVFYIVFHFTQRIWAKRINLLIAALNVAWATRNFFLISACAAGECPQKKISIYILLFSSLIMMVSALFPDIKLSKNEE